MVWGNVEKKKLDRLDDIGKILQAKQTEKTKKDTTLSYHM